MQFSGVMVMFCLSKLDAPKLYNEAIHGTPFSH